MTPTPLLAWDAVPLVVGARPTPSHPAGIPDRVPLAIQWAPRLGLVSQVPNRALEELLTRVYAHGSLLGTAMDDTALGRPYALDFLDFMVSAARLEGADLLEIGCGRGYLLRLAAEQGARAVGLETGCAHTADWRRNGVQAFPEAFPSACALGPFDVVSAYGVLEHIPCPRPFLEAAAAALKPGGRVLLAVPDCAPYLAAGDPSCLVHEHWHYFTAGSLRRVLTDAGLNPLCVRRASVGGVLYAVATPGRSLSPADPPASELEEAIRFARRAEATRRLFHEAVEAHSAHGRTLGIFAPVRGLISLPAGRGVVRFFDDDPELVGRYYPPFDVPVEDRVQLLRAPPDTLWILSRSFGARIAAQLEGLLPGTEICTPAALDRALDARCA